MLSGEDWPHLKIEGNMCGDTNQSPIDLKTSGWNVMMFKKDNFNSVWQDQTGGNILVQWVGTTSRVRIDKPG